MRGKTAVISGSSKGIGAAIAIELSERGANIVLNYPFPHHKDECEAIGQTLKTEWIAVCADMSTTDGPGRLVAEAVARFRQIDILVSNAGIVPLGPLWEADAKTWDQTFNLNSRGPFLLTKAALPHLTPYIPPTAAAPGVGGGSRIILVSSVASRAPEQEQSIYAASKGALESLVRVWAQELPPKYGCTVNGVAPGPIRTLTFLENIEPHFDMVKSLLDAKTPIEGAFGEVEDVAWTVAFLAEGRSRWINELYTLLTGGAYIC
ncbi:hypothetical protein F4779DRAFT_591165 [Xylariaceae sp. FL0662B]|nr:hypothetical protein F4779DRAFT_591165 [Xylariaceae sp. FL0662B]